MTNDRNYNTGFLSHKKQHQTRSLQDVKFTGKLANNGEQDLGGGGGGEFKNVLTKRTAPKRTRLTRQGRKSKTDRAYCLHKAKSSSEKCVNGERGIPSFKAGRGEQKREMEKGGLKQDKRSATPRGKTAIWRKENSNVSAAEGIGDGGGMKGKKENWVAGLNTGELVCLEKQKVGP